MTPEPWYRLAIRPRVVKRAALMALVVGHVLGAINHGHSILAGTMTGSDWARFGLTFLVPYCVSTLSSILAIRENGRVR
ncbi:MAG: nitrate/nitrite transporter NrtS [Paracoccaceae bacterium]|nr:nitrate/nitrite transporter NrtS [Paracoccaceae bacterium]